MIVLRSATLWTWVDTGTRHLSEAMQECSTEQKNRLSSALTKVSWPSLSETTVGNDETLSSAVRIDESRSPAFPPSLSHALFHLTCQWTRTRWHPVTDSPLRLFRTQHWAIALFISVKILSIPLSDVYVKWHKAQPLIVVIVMNYYALNIPMIKHQLFFLDLITMLKTQ